MLELFAVYDMADFVVPNTQKSCIFATSSSEGPSVAPTVTVSYPLGVGGDSKVVEEYIYKTSVI